jgi:hypothetical protein
LSLMRYDVDQAKQTWQKEKAALELSLKEQEKGCIKVKERMVTMMKALVREAKLKKTEDEKRLNDKIEKLQAEAHSYKRKIARLESDHKGKERNYQDTISIFQEEVRDLKEELKDGRYKHGG